jgi:hypothetical protein
MQYIGEEAGHRVEVDRTDMWFNRTTASSWILLMDSKRQQGSRDLQKNFEYPSTEAMMGRWCFTLICGEPWWTTTFQIQPNDIVVIQM